MIDPNRLPSVRPSFNSGESQWTMPLRRTYLRSHGFASAEHSEGAAALMRIKDGWPLRLAVICARPTIKSQEELSAITALKVDNLAIICLLLLRINDYHSSAKHSWAVLRVTQNFPVQFHILSNMRCQVPANYSSLTAVWSATVYVTPELVLESFLQVGRHLNAPLGFPNGMLLQSEMEWTYVMALFTDLIPCPNMERLLNISCILWQCRSCRCIIGRKRKIS